MAIFNSKLLVHRRVCCMYAHARCANATMCVSHVGIPHRPSEPRWDSRNFSPASFSCRLAAALASQPHHGVPGLEKNDAIQTSVFWHFQIHHFYMVYRCFQAYRRLPVEKLEVCYCDLRFRPGTCLNHLNPFPPI